MKRIFVMAVILAVVSSGLVVAGMGGSGQGVIKKKAAYKPDTILVRFKPGASEEAKGKAQKELKATQVKKFHFVDGLVSVKLPPGRSIEDAIAQILKNPNVLYAEPDYELAPTSTNDSSWNELWGLENTGQTVNYTPGTVDADMNIPEAWSNGGTTGSSDIIIGVIDTGVNYNHPDLNANLWRNPNEIAGNNIDDDNNGFIDDVYGANTITGSGDPMDGHSHGTHVAGTIAAVGSNGTGITGVNQSAKVVSCKFLPDSGSGSTTDAIECLQYMYDLKQAGVNLVVTNNSWGGGGYSASLEAAIDAHRQAGIVFVAAAGNDNTNNDSGAHYPSNYFLPNIIAVAATDQNDNRASFSNYGLRSVHVAAPGVNIYSTIHSSGYAHYQGTSMASPHVAGLVALLKAKNPAMSWISLKNLVVASGTPTASISGNTVTGRRVRAWDTDGTGAMTCSNQTVKSTIYPQSASTVSVSSGGTVSLAMMHINCASGAGNLSVSTSGPEAVANLTLYDDGQGFDKVAGDGIYSGQWTAPNTGGSYTLTMADGQTVSVSVTAPSSNGLTAYRTPVEIAYNPRTSAYGYSALPDGYYYYINGYTTYFTIPFGGYSAGFNTIYGTTFGTAMMSLPSANQLTGANTALANSTFETLIAPYWDDLNLTAAGNGVRGWWMWNGSTGEVIMEWKGTQKSTGALVNIQLVFSANSSDVEMHYISSDNGAQSATVGIQVDGTRGVAQSVNIANSNLVSGKAWRWSLDGGAPTVSAGSDQNVNGNDTVYLSATGTDPDGGSLSYLWSQQSGTAVSISNGNSANASFVAPNNTESLVFKVTATDDSGSTATDTVTINVTAVSAGPGDIALTSSSYGVGENGGTVTISATRSGGTTGAVSVSFATSNGTATAGSDYVANSGTLNWADGESGNKSFTVTISDDSSYEGDENFSVALSNATGGASLGNNSATVTITENDPIPVPGNVGFSLSSYSVAENGGSVTITVNRTGGSDGAVSVNYATSNGSASAGSDYTSKSGTLNWADGDSASKTFTVAILDDATYEGSESVNLSLSNASGGISITAASSTLTITDNDPQPVPGSLSLSAASYSVAENAGTVSITVSRSGGSDGAVSVNYATSNGSASAGSDYASASGSLNWADGESGSKSFTVSIANDSVYEGNETVAINLGSVSGGASLGTSAATLTILEDDAAPAFGSLSFSNTNYSVNENNGSVTISVARSNGSSGAVSVNYVTTNGSAVAGSDYVSASGTLNWADGDTAAKTFTVSISDDAVYEGSETVSLSLNTVAGGAVITGATATLTINDDEQANVAPTAPKLVSPSNGELGVTPIFTLFEWLPSRDRNKDTISYDFYYCTDASFNGCSPYNVVASLGSDGMMMAGLGGGSGLLMLGMVYGLSRRRKWLYVGMAVVALSLGACKPENPNTIKVTVTVLDQNTTYYWKVVAKDGKGGETASDVWSFTTGQ